MEENKTIIETENTTEIESKTESQNTAQVKKQGSKKYWKIGIVALLALAVIAGAIVWIVLANKPEPEAEEPVAEILAEDISKYTLISAQSLSGGAATQFWKLETQIKEMYGSKPQSEKDYTDATEFEILVGNTNREETETFLSGLLWNDYGYAIIDNKIVIAGHTNEGTANAMKHFLEHLKSGDHTTVFFSNKDQYVFRYPYLSDSFMLNGIDVSRAKIVVNEEKGSDAQIAQSLSDKSLEVCGRRPEIVTDVEVKEGEPLIIIGISALVPDKLQNEWDASYATTEGKSAYCIGKEGNVMWIYTSVMEGYGAINRELLPQLQSDSTTSAVLGLGIAKIPQVFSVMSFNVFVSQFNTARAQRVTDTILENMPSVFGVQEANDNWMSTLRGKLGEFYSSVGVGRDANLQGEYSAIFYRTDKFKLIESGTKWLSDTPDVSGSKFTEANFPRIMTYAILERQTDGVQFLYVNTHLDHNGKNNTTPEVAEMVRQRQIEVLLSEIAKLPDLPTIVTGDFNVTPVASAYTTMTANGFLDASRVAWAGEVLPTYNGMNDSYIGEIIDYIFVSPELAQAVDTYTVCPSKREGEWISDHNAIIATITLPVSDSEE